MAGTDPLQAALQVPEAMAFTIEAVAPWGPVADLDPYHCNLRFHILTDAPRTEVEQAIRYELDQVSFSPVSARDLVQIAGEPSDGPVWDDFYEAASAQYAAGDLAAIRASAATLRSFTGPGLWRNDALSWLEDAGLRHRSGPRPRPRPDRSGRNRAFRRRREFHRIRYCVGGSDHAIGRPQRRGGSQHSCGPTASPRQRRV